LRTPLARLHAASCAATLVPILLAVPVIAAAGSVAAAAKGLLALGVLVASAPAMTHATASAIVRRRPDEGA
jgi:hypothetical protein